MSHPSSLFSKYAQTYADKYMDVSKYQESLDLFCNALPQKKCSILDVACGPGNLTKFILSQRPNDNLLGIDLAPEMLEIAKALNPTAAFKALDIRKINTLKDAYDGIICGFGLPYLSQEETLQLLHDASVRLNPKGLLYISTMEGHYADSKWIGPSSGGDDRIFTYYHEEDYLKNCLLEHHLIIRDISRVITKEEDETETTDLIIIAQKI